MDPIADMITRIKNANRVGKASVSMPHSKLRMAVLEKLVSEGFISTVTKKNRKGKKFIEAGLSYNSKKPRVNEVERISKLSRRIYMKSSQLRPIKHGRGRLILSTPKGILTGKEARENKLGGEALFAIW